MNKLRKEQADGWTKQELAEYYGLESFDCALPQDWLNDMARKMSGFTNSGVEDCYETIRSMTVWNYPAGNIFGEPFYFYAGLDVVMKCAAKGD